MILTLDDVDGDAQEMFLVSKSKLPVPKYSWKVVQDTVSKKAIAFVTVNNPFLDSVSKEDIFCPDVCKATGWGVAAWTNAAKGYTYCCDVNDLKKVIKTIPDVQYSGLLSAKNEVIYRFLQ